MTPRKTGCHLVGIFIVLFVAANGRADLFVELQPQNSVVRIDSSSGAVLETYPNPIFGSGSTTSGLAFDGQFLYMTRHNPNAGFDWLFTLDALYGAWTGPTLMSTLPNPSGQPQAISGLGVIGDPFNFETLVAVTRNPVDAPPSYILTYDMFGPPFDPILPGPSTPAGELPMAFDAQGAEIDRATGELWIVADELTSSGRVPRLLHTDLEGNVLETLTPPLPGPTLIRGLAFDGDAMFIAGRNLPSSTNFIYQIDRTSGAIVQSFSLGSTGNIAGLAGGSLVPEPSAAAAVGLALISLALKRRRKDDRTRAGMLRSRIEYKFA